MKKKGSLVVVGSGIKSISHITIETRNLIKDADKVLYILADFLSKEWISKMNSSSEDMHKFYANGKPRDQSYNDMNDYTMSFVRKGLKVCVVYYGHPGVFCAPGHLSVIQAKKEGFDAIMLPGISSEDCLFSDLNIDPAHGCQSFESTSFLIYKRAFDPSSILVLWQIGVTGHLDFQDQGYNAKHGVRVMTEYLLNFYPSEHSICVYEAALYCTCLPAIQRLELKDLPEADINSASTLLIYPYLGKFMGADIEMLKKLKIQDKFIKYKLLAEIEDN